jgi:hypothetical protein
LFILNFTFWQNIVSKKKWHEGKHFIPGKKARADGATLIFELRVSDTIKTLGEAFGNRPKETIGSRPSPKL